MVGVLLTAIITAGIVLTKLIYAVHDYAVTRAIVKYTGKAPDESEENNG